MISKIISQIPSSQVDFCILISPSKKTKEPELSEVLSPRGSVFLFKGYKHTHFTPVMGK